jgi:hypothetical protein
MRPKTEAQGRHMQAVLEHGQRQKAIAALYEALGRTPVRAGGILISPHLADAMAELDAAEKRRKL